MPAVTRVNPTPIARGTIQRNMQQTVYKVVLSGAGLAQIGTDAKASFVTDTLGSVGHIMQFKSNGNELYFVADRHAIDLDWIATQIAKVLDTGVFTVTGGVATLSDTQTVTVTEPTDLEGM